jgi:membrane associated rhomboid family serine protease
MLIVPLARKIDWYRPPLVTLLLIVVNVAIYALTKDSDEQAFDRAITYYAASPLIRIEPPLYLDHLHAVGELGKERALRRALARDRDDGLDELLAALEGDQPFLTELRGGRAVTPADPRYAQWRSARREFERLWREGASYRYGFVPAQHSPATFVTSQFMHGSWEHVIGNMVVLFVVGFMVEAALGWWRFLAVYLIGGVGAATVFWAFYPHSTVPLIGASGAVAAVVGMYTAIFGLRRINFFYFVVVYFDYVKAPALIVLALWIGNEAFQLLTHSESHIAYAAHIGGLVSGAALVGILRWLRVRRLSAFLAEVDRESGAKSEYARALALLGQLRFDEANEILERLVEVHADDLELVLQAYNVAKHTPASPAYHRAARRVFALPDGNRAMVEIIATTFIEYLAHAKPAADIGPELALELAGKLSHGGRMNEAEQLAQWLVQHRRGVPGVAAALLRVADAYSEVSNHGRAQHWRRAIARDFPDSAAAQRLESSGLAG